MKSHILAAVVFFGTAASAQTIYFGAESTANKKNEFCSYSATVPSLMAGTDASHGVKNLVASLNAKSKATLAQVDAEYKKALAEKDACSTYESSYQTASDFKIPTNLGGTVVSIYSTTYSYFGGAHGSTGLDTVTFNTKTGDTYANLADFFDESKTEAIKAKILEKVKATDSNFDIDNGWTDWDKKHNSVSQVENFYVNDYGIVIYFQQYEIASYSEGIIEVTLDWGDLQTIGLNNSPAAKALLANNAAYQ